MTADTSVEAAEARIERRRSERRHAAIGGLPDEAVVALLAAPFWTPAALRQCGLDPDALAAARGLVRVDRDDMFLLEVAAVPGLRARVPSAPLPILVELGTQLHGMDKLPPVLADWAGLARRLGTHDGAGVIEEVSARCDANDLGNATQLLEAAEALARIGIDAVAIEVRLARYRIEREFRIARDRRSLQSYVPRDEAMAAFRALLDTDDQTGPWALHYIGIGGTGKTTFIRHLAVDAANELDIAVARIDFDYLSPAYPARDPGQLVAAIVHELAGQSDRAEQDRWMESVKLDVEHLRDLAMAARPESSPLGSIAWGEFDEMIYKVSSFIGSLKRRPVIVLDTCEELLKLPSTEGKIPSVEATFALVEKLHGLIPRLRVVFAGRRLLATAGAGWSATSAVSPRGLSEPHSWLSLCELRGMTRAEASVALDQLLPEQRRSDEALRTAILATSPEDHRVNGLQRNVNTEVARYSPYKLIRYGRWVASDPTLSPSDLADGGDPYIEQRVVQRLGAHGAFLPIIVQLRRFDLATFTAVIGEKPTTAGQLFEDLAGFDWMEVSLDATRGMVIGPKRPLRKQLEAYLVQMRADEWQSARVATARVLGSRLDAEPRPVLLAPELVSAVLRATSDAEAVERWFSIERTIGCDWASAEALTRFLISDGADDSDDDTFVPRTLLDCALMATQISSEIHEHPEVDVTDKWRALADVLAKLAQCEAASFLTGRAELGFVAAAAWVGRVPIDKLIQTFAEIVEDVYAVPEISSTWIVAALEALVERLERQLDDLPELTRFLDGTWWDCAWGSAGLETFAQVLHARAQMLLGDDRKAIGRRLFETYKRKRWELPDTCADWLSPASLPARVRLEVLRLLEHEIEVSAAWDDTESDEIDADQDRLRAALMMLTGESRKPVRVAKHSLGVREPKVYKLVKTAAYVAETMRVDAGAEIVYELDAIERVRVLTQRARRHRAIELLPPRDRSKTAAELDLEIAQAYAIVLGRAETIDAKTTTEAIASWSFQRAITPREREAAVDAMRPHLAGITRLALKRSVAGATAAACLEEVGTLSRGTRSPIEVERIRHMLSSSAVHPDQREQIQRLKARSAATRKAASIDVPAHLIFDEAELLSLRFPDRAAHLFGFLAKTRAFAQLADLHIAELKLLQKLAAPLGEPGQTLAAEASRPSPPDRPLLRRGISPVAGRVDLHMGIGRIGEAVLASLATESGQLTEQAISLEIGEGPRWPGERLRDAIATHASRISPDTLLVDLMLQPDLAPYAWEPAFVREIPNAIIVRGVPPSRGVSVRGLAPRIPDRYVDVWNARSDGAFAHIVGTPRRVPKGIALDDDRNVGAGLVGFDIVLQLAPQERDQASAATRTELSLLRELGLALIERGARSVLVLPAMSRSEEPRVLAAVAAALGAAANRDLAELAAAARAARNLLTISEVADHVTIADEITLLAAIDKDEI